MRAGEAYRQALSLYAKAAAFAGVPATIRLAQRGLDQVARRLAELSEPTVPSEPGSRRNGGALLSLARPGSWRARFSVREHGGARANAPALLPREQRSRCAGPLMGVSYTSALERDVRRTANSARRLGTRHALLPLTSLVAALAIGLAYSGRIHTLNRSSQATVRVVNLSAVDDAKRPRGCARTPLPNPADRRFAARGLFQLLCAVRDAGDDLPNVGAILKVTATVDAIERALSLVAYTERLRDARERAVRSRTAAAGTLPLFTNDDLATLKPSLVVRTPETFARVTLAYGAAYVSPFISWCCCGRSAQSAETGYCWLPPHLLTAVGSRCC